MRFFLATLATLFIACNTAAAEPPCVPPKSASEYRAVIEPSPEPTCEKVNDQFARPARFIFLEGKLLVAGDVTAVEQKITVDRCRNGVILQMTDDTVRVFLFSWDKSWSRGTGFAIIDGCRLPMSLKRAGTDI